MKFQQTCLICFVNIFVVVYITLDITLNDQIWEWNISLTKALQDNQSTGLDWMFLFFSYLAYIPPIASIYCYLFRDNKLNSILYLVVVIISVTSNELLKSLYHQPRPYMIEDDGIEGIKCNSDYGKPSGHSQNTMVMLTMLPFLLFPSLKNFSRRKKSAQVVDEYTRSRVLSHTGFTIESQQLGDYKQKSNLSSNDQDQQISQTSITFKIIFFLLLYVTVFMTGLSRIYLGVHTVGQVVLGFVYGLYISFMYIQLVHFPLRNKILQIINARFTVEHRGIIVPISILLLIFLIILDIILLELNVNFMVSFDEKQLWLFRVNECSKSSYDFHYPKLLYNGPFCSTGFGAMITGLTFGMLKSRGSYEEGLFESNYFLLHRRKRILRIIIFISLFLFLIPFVFIQSNNIYIQLFLQVIPVSLYVGIVLTWIYPLILRKYKFSIQGDIFHKGNSKKQQRLLLDLEQSMEQTDDYYFSLFLFYSLSFINLTSYINFNQLVYLY
ncbi:hypothetical protein pb186bvf_015450 [Paramecium bursaria]